MEMFVRLAAAVLAAVFMLASQAASAAALFGTEEKIHYIQDVDITSQDNQPLFLGYKTSTTYLLAGVSITDDGYVFGLRSDHTKFIATSPEEIAKFQASGLLPTPLPPYQISMIDYLLGYSLWIVLPIIVIVYLVGWMRKRKAAVPATT
jgi:hypothetical protein